MSQRLGQPNCANVPAHIRESPLKWGFPNNEMEHGRCSHWGRKRGFRHTPQITFLSSKQTRLQPYMSVPSAHLQDLPTSLIQHHFQLPVVLCLTTPTKKGNCIPFSFFLLAMLLSGLSTPDFLPNTSYSIL